MSLHYLLGPLLAGQSVQWQTNRAAGRCLAFNTKGDCDLTVATIDSWDDVCRRLPHGWRPDFVTLNLGYTSIPPGLWAAPAPLVGLAPDWSLLWHHYRRVLRRCDLVLTDASGVEALAREGIGHARHANLFGCAPELLDGPRPDGPRDIDVLFVGNLQPAVQGERLAWLGRLARLAGRRKVVIAAGVFGADYRALVARARVVFNRSVRGECNLRAMEAAAAGALLFQEAGNREVADYFRPGHECVFYGDDDLESLLEHYLDNEGERLAVAEAARRRVRDWSFPAFWDRALGTVEAEWQELLRRAADRSPPDEDEALLGRTWQAVSCADGGDPELAGDLARALAARPDAAALHNALGVARSLVGVKPTDLIDHFRRAVAADPTHLVAAMNWFAALIEVGDRATAADAARQALATLDRVGSLSPAVLDGQPYPSGFDVLRVEWERAAWENAGRPAAEARAKHDLLRWRAHTLLAELTGDLAHHREAALTRPDLPATRAALGCALGRAGRAAEAVPHLRRAVAANPFDRPAARALFQALGDAGDLEGQRAFAADRRLLSRAAPQVVPPEPWFSETPAPAVDHSAAGPAKAQPLSLEEFHRRFGDPDTARAVHSFTPPLDTHVVLALLAHGRPRRVLEIGTAGGHMTANLTEWTPDDAVVFTLGAVADLPAGAPEQQRYEVPPRAEFGRFADHFGKAHKVLFATADSLHYDFGRMAPLDFAFIDGAHDLAHVLSDTLKAYEALSPGGCLVWHDFGSPVPWVEVSRALERIDFAETIYRVAGTSVAFLHKGSGASPPVVRAAETPAEAAAEQSPVAAADAPARRTPFAVVWEGVQEEMQSLALVNRQLCLRLIGRGHEVSVFPLNFPPEIAVPALPAPPALAARFRAPLSRPCEVHVRHCWPPDFRPPPAGRWVLIQPWEFGSLPRDWVGPINDQVDEVWAYTREVRDCYVESGVPADRVYVVPLGVDVGRFRPGATPLPLQNRRRFRFLFVGGTIHRKGFDVLLAAYARAFTAADDVCLVVKDMGAGSFYRGQTAEGEVARLRATRGAPEVEYLDRPLTEEELPGLYAACDCLASPYRGEGFALPVAEAMACGLPVVVTGKGAALDYCDESRAYLVPAEVRYLPERRVGELDTVGRPWLAEPDAEALAAILRHVVAHPDEARAKGAAGRDYVCGNLTWEHAADAVERRLEALRGRPIRRPVQAAVPRRMRVSLSMIVKDEEANLPECLASAADLVDEVVVVDTGSADRTKEVATRFHARVFDFPWVDDFAAARNEGLKHVTGDWAFWLDADDRLDGENRARLKALFDGLRDENAAYVMKCLCLPDPETRTATVVDHVRLFRNDPALRWEYRVHEQILPALRRGGGDVRWSDVVVRHVGYQDPALRRRKLERDGRILRLEHADKPDDPFILFNLGSIAQELGRCEEAVTFLGRSLALSNPKDSIVRKLYALLAQGHRRLGQDGLALAACRKGREFYPDDVELLFQEGVVLRARGDRAGARRCWTELLRPRPADHFASLDTGLSGYKTRHNLAQLELEEGNLSGAEAHWRAVLAEQAAFMPAHLGLGEVYLRRGRWDDLERAAAALASDGRAADGDVLRAQGHLARKEFPSARRLLEAAITKAPQAVALRRVLSYALLQEGKDWSAAERALCELLKLDPGDAEARNNLALLLRQQGRSLPP